MDLEQHSSDTSSSTEHSPSATAASPSISSPTSSQASSPASTSLVATHKRKAGRKKFRETRHPLYRGVRERNGGKWVCEVREPQKKNRIWLGTYATPEMAARAHDVAALALRGESAPLNFPNSVRAIPRAVSCSVEDIRKAAVEAAEMFRPAWANATGTSASPRERRRLAAGTSSESTTLAAGDQVPDQLFLDEEALFNMPGLLKSMAEGMLLTPPGMPQSGFDWDDVNGYVDTSLWRH